MVTLYNTLTRKKELLKPVKEGKISIYACGPTVYDYFHIGNARIFILFDVLRRYLAYRGYQVTFVQNFTDIDDKMINRAADLGISVAELAARFIHAYQEDAAALGVLPADHHPRATEHIPQIVSLIQKLLAKNLAYEIDGDVYFRVKAFPAYGQLSHQDLEELHLGARVEVDVRKEHPMDFALWKKEKPGEPSWESPWGRGRPGWHIECSAMSMHYLGETLDIHAGGQDLIFPHHENEIAQSEGATAKTFARHWVHAGYLNIDREKMSKSLGNVLTIKELQEKVDPLILRFFMLSAHYRSPINFSEEHLQQAAKALERLHTLIYNLEDALPKTAGDPPDDREEKTWQINLETYRQRFIEAMDDDFNTAGAFAVLFELARDANIYLNCTKPQRSVTELILKFYRETDEIFGFLKKQPGETGLEEKIAVLIADREEARRRKDWALADSIRDRLREKGIILEDTPQGVRWRASDEQGTGGGT